MFFLSKGLFWMGLYRLKLFQLMPLLFLLIQQYDPAYHYTYPYTAGMLYLYLKKVVLFLFYDQLQTAAKHSFLLQGLGYRYYASQQETNFYLNHQNICKEHHLVLVFSVAFVDSNLQK